MRLLDRQTSKPLKNVIIYLTLSEARELADKIGALISCEDDHHEHISSDDYQKEITLTIYENRPIESFDERSRRLILEDV